MKVPPDAIEVEAGVSNFDKFGEFNVIYSLANGDVTKYNAVFNIEYSEAFITLYRKAEEMRFTKKLNALLKKQTQ